MSSDNWDQYSVIGDEGEVGFIDFADDKSVASYNQREEGPFEVSVPFPFVSGKPQSVLVSEVAAESFTIKNTTEEEMELWLSIYASNPKDSFQLSLMKPPSGQPDDVPEEDFVGSFSMDERILRPHETLTIWLSCQPKEIGVYTSIVNIESRDDCIERVVFLLVEDKVSKSLASHKPYRRGRKKNTSFTVDSYVRGVRPTPNNPMQRPYKNKLALYPISQDDREVLANNQIPESVMNGLSRKNYVSYFKSLLIMEELGLEEDMKVYDMEAASMKRKGRFLTLEVPGLAERRPSLVHGDAIYAKVFSTDPDNAPVYEGYIHRVEADEINLQFAVEFHRHHSVDDLYNIHFAYNRVNFRRLYQAIEAAEALRANFLFPSDNNAKRRIRPSQFEPISHLNEEQSNAVGLIMGCKGGAPYVIHGPPGTGKTKTLVEVILQLYRSRPKSRLLVCASSNYAADHIFETLLRVGKETVQIKDNEVFRLNAASRPSEDVGPDYMKYCYMEELVFKCPPVEVLLLYRIVVTTYMSACLLHAEGVKRGHFSHIVLDEAGQASEPETMVPIANFSHKDSVIVLAGDPKQLGPVINSRRAEENGLGTSYLERLFESELYCKGDQNYVTMLVKNYRCHPEILSLPSKMFYDDMLIPAREISDSLPWTDLLSNTEFPVLFFGIQGLDEREGSNPSWFNRIEASKVVEMIRKLVAKDVAEEDIGVITPYRQQVAKIKTALECCGMGDIKIGSVEQFQGQEREVIIVSTVRSTIKHNEFDAKCSLGFLSNPKRFNVAMTRARSLLVIIGNPHIISQDTHWEQMLWHCVENDSYQGCGLPEKKSSCPPAYDAGWEPDGGDAVSKWDGGGADSNWDWVPEEANNKMGGDSWDENGNKNNNKMGGDGWDEPAWNPENGNQNNSKMGGDGWDEPAWNPENGNRNNKMGGDGWDEPSWNPENGNQNNSKMGGVGWDEPAWNPENGNQNNNKMGGDGWDEPAWNPENGNKNNSKMGGDGWDEPAWDPERTAPAMTALSLCDEERLGDSNEPGEASGESFRELPKPKRVKDEDEWSEGWRS